MGTERRDIPAEASCRAQPAIGALIGSADFRRVAVRVPRPRCARDRTAADGVHLAAAAWKAVAGSDLIDGGRRRVLVSAADPRSTEDGPTEDEAGQQSNHDFPRSSFFRTRCLPTPTDKKPSGCRRERGTSGRVLAVRFPYRCLPTSTNRTAGARSHKMFSPIDECLVHQTAR